MMNKPAMTPERLLDLIAAYGADPGAWPLDERAEAQALILIQPEAFEAALSEARILDAALNLEQVPSPSPSLATAILSEAPRPARSMPGKSWVSDVLSGTFRLPAGAAMASLGVGLVAGYAYAGDTGFEAYLEDDSAPFYALEESFDDWLASNGDIE